MSDCHSGNFLIVKNSVIVEDFQTASDLSVELGCDSVLTEGRMSAGVGTMYPLRASPMTAAKIALQICKVRYSNPIAKTHLSQPATGRGLALSNMPKTMLPAIEDSPTMLPRRESTLERLSDSVANKVQHDAKYSRSSAASRGKWLMRSKQSFRIT